ncbi:hypothetical protein ACLQ24_23040 [Micromonospora sp. DT4]
MGGCPCCPPCATRSAPHRWPAAELVAELSAAARVALAAAAERATRWG